MKTGAIVYVVGKENVSEDFNMAAAVKNLAINAERVEIVSPASGHFDIMDAWWSLTAKGMKKIICLIAEVVNGTELKLTGRKIQLCE